MKHLYLFSLFLILSSCSVYKNSFILENRGSNLILSQEVSNNIGVSEIALNKNLNTKLLNNCLNGICSESIAQYIYETKNKNKIEKNICTSFFIGNKIMVSAATCFPEKKCTGHFEFYNQKTEKLNKLKCKKKLLARVENFDLGINYAVIKLLDDPNVSSLKISSESLAFDSEFFVIGYSKNKVMKQEKLKCIRSDQKSVITYNKVSSSQFLISKCSIKKGMAGAPLLFKKNNEFFVKGLVYGAYDFNNYYTYESNSSLHYRKKTPSKYDIDLETKFNAQFSFAMNINCMELGGTVLKELELGKCIPKNNFQKFILWIKNFVFSILTSFLK